MHSNERSGSIRAFNSDFKMVAEDEDDVSTRNWYWVRAFRNNWARINKKKRRDALLRLCKYLTTKLGCQNIRLNKSCVPLLLCREKIKFGCQLYNYNFLTLQKIVK